MSEKTCPDLSIVLSDYSGEKLKFSGKCFAFNEKMKNFLELTGKKDPSLELVQRYLNIPEVASGLSEAARRVKELNRIPDWAKEYSLSLEQRETAVAIRKKETERNREISKKKKIMHDEYLRRADQLEKKYPSFVNYSSSDPVHRVASAMLITRHKKNEKFVKAQELEGEARDPLSFT